MTAEQAAAIAEALSGSYDGNQHVAITACEQAADELNVLGQAIGEGASDWLVRNVIMGVENRLRAAAKLADDVELARHRNRKAAE